MAFRKHVKKRARDTKLRNLQKWKNSELAERLPSNIENILSQILDNDKLSIDDLFNLSDEERKKIETVLTAGYLTLAGNDRDKFVDHTEEVLSEGSRNEIWERNHFCILNVISWQANSQGRIPTIKEICEETQLSRVTVTKHLKEYYESDTYREKENVYKFLREKLITKVYGFAYDGNMRAAKIFMDATANLNDPGTKIQNQQNNFIQINGITVTEQQIQKLPMEKQMQVKEILLLVGS